VRIPNRDADEGVSEVRIPNGGAAEGAAEGHGVTLNIMRVWMKVSVVIEETGEKSESDLMEITMPIAHTKARNGNRNGMTLIIWKLKSGAILLKNWNPQIMNLNLSW
jgi:hypothetical protein